MKNNSCLLALILFVLSSCVSNSNEAVMYSHVDKNNSVRLVSTHSGEYSYDDESLFGEYLKTVEHVARDFNPAAKKGELWDDDGYWQGIAFETKHGREYYLFDIPKKDFSKRKFIVELISRCEIINEYNCNIGYIESKKYYGSFNQYRKIHGITTWEDWVEGVLTVADVALEGLVDASSNYSQSSNQTNISSEVRLLRSEINSLKRQKILEQNTLKIEPSIYKPKEKK